MFVKIQADNNVSWKHVSDKKFQFLNCNYDYDSEKRMMVPKIYANEHAIYVYTKRFRSGKTSFCKGLCADFNVSY